MKRETKAVEYLSVAEVAAGLGVSNPTVVRRFEHLDGVLDLGSQESMHRRRHRILRIPRSVLDRYIAEHQANRPHHQRK